LSMPVWMTMSGWWRCCEEERVAPDEQMASPNF
jgi:hypothetical protein